MDENVTKGIKLESLHVYIGNFLTIFSPIVKISTNLVTLVKVLFPAPLKVDIA
jgi:hypothetical protein